MTTSYNQSLTSASDESGDGGAGDQNTMTILVVLVCVIGLIALTLTVVLIIVCIKRRPKVELIEHVYAVPGACQTLSHTYLGDNPPEPPGPRPRLVQPYCDVVDARPPDQPPQPTPASPAYAEVEEVCDVDFDEKALRRFQFKARATRPSVSSAGGSSAHYEDICPVPVTKPVARNNAQAASKHSTLPNYKTPLSNKMATGSSSSSPAVKNSVSAGSNHYSTTGTRAGRSAQQDSVGGSSNPSAREKHVYVHVVDTPDGGTDTGKNKTQTANSKTQTDKSAVAPLVAKYISASGPDSKPAGAKVAPRGKTETPSSRLYPLQEGRVASLVSTLNRSKQTTAADKVNEQTKAVS